MKVKIIDTTYTDDCEGVFNITYTVIHRSTYTISLSKELYYNTTYPEMEVAYHNLQHVQVGDTYDITYRKAQLSNGEVVTVLTKADNVIRTTDVKQSPATLVELLPSDKRVCL